MSMQRRRGRIAKIHQVETVTDKRGNTVETPTADFLSIRAWAIPQRGARAELPGQQQVKIIEIGTEHDLSRVTLWSRVEWAGEWWDVVVPPQEHWGTRHVRHWSITLRWRPDAGGGL